ncbi:MAG: hypothetical protein F6K00_14560 [Leptolyngbya sp. SIOISBB]|nr:hypothetical protein [Leptolyngbya sp. SIOISBB]
MLLLSKPAVSTLYVFMDITPLNRSRLRYLALLGAVIGWSTVLVRFGLTVQTSLVDGNGWGYAIVLYLGYFTILTNWCVTLALTARLLPKRFALQQFLTHPQVISAIATAIAIVCIVYFLLLRQLWNPQGLALVLDTTLHYVMPALFLLYWWLAIPRRTVQLRNIPRWLVYPLGYLVYTLIRGEITGLYPYPFIDVDTLGYGRALLNSVGILIGFMAIAALLVGINTSKPSPPSTQEKVL